MNIFKRIRNSIEMWYERHFGEYEPVREFDFQKAQEFYEANRSVLMEMALCMGFDDSIVLKKSSLTLVLYISTISLSLFSFSTTSSAAQSSSARRFCSALGGRRNSCLEISFQLMVGERPPTDMVIAISMNCLE